MHRAFTSGAARRAEVTSRYVHAPMIIKSGPTGELEFRTEADDENAKMIEQVTKWHDRAGRINPILDIFRDDTYQGDPDLGHHAHEWLFQLARHWSEWQSPRIGTFPLDYRDPSGPLTKAESEESGEDRVYWEIEAVLDEVDDLAPGGNTQQDHIVHATAVLSRILDLNPIG
jgi:hypothetical protein